MAEIRYRTKEKGGGTFVIYSDEEVRQMKNTDMICFLESEYGYHFKQTGQTYKGIEHDSLIIDADRKTWYWNSRGKKCRGYNVVDWLMKVEYMDYKEILQKILGAPVGGSDAYTPKKHVVAPEVTEPKVKELELPPIYNGRFKQMFGYLTQKRKLDYEIIQDLAARNYIYQGYKEYKSKETGETFTYYSTVFLGYDENNQVKFAEVKPTAQYRTNIETGEQEKTYGRNAYGSDKRYSFNVPAYKSKFPQTADILYVFEAPVDLLSHCTLSLMEEKRRAAAEGRRYDPDAWKNVNRLSLSGCSDVALKSYLERNPNIKRIVFALDNDSAGRNAALELEKSCSEKGYLCKKVLPPQGKDFNEYLCAVCNRKETATRLKPKPSPVEGENAGKRRR